MMNFRASSNVFCMAGSETAETGGGKRLLISGSSPLISGFYRAIVA